jgi:hypothetical protein
MEEIQVLQEKLNTRFQITRVHEVTHNLSSYNLTFGWKFSSELSNIDDTFAVR